jgi:hypothetical protein
MVDKSVHFTRFLANLMPKVLKNDACAILLSGPVGLHCIKIFAPYNSIYAHIVKVYIF